MGKSTQITGASLMNQHQMRCQPSDPEPASLVNRGRQDVLGGGAHIITFNVREIGPQRPQSPPAVSLEFAKFYVQIFIYWTFGNGTH